MLKRWIEITTSTKTWLVDTEFLLSDYECQWGTGCKGINPNRPDLGCCANGAYLTDSDVELLKDKVPQLKDSEWQHKTDDYLTKSKYKTRLGIKRWDGQLKTSVQNDDDEVSGCVFANDPDFQGGMGCALHIAAVNRGEDFIEWKPEICWQMPLYIEEIEELEVNILRMFHWGESDYPWFCERDREMWVGKNPVYQSMSKELKKMLDNEDPEFYDILKDVLDKAHSQGVKASSRPVPVTLTSKF